MDIINKYINEIQSNKKDRKTKIEEFITILKEKNLKGYDFGVEILWKSIKDIFILSQEKEMIDLSIELLNTYLNGIEEKNGMIFKEMVNIIYMNEKIEDVNKMKILEKIGDINVLIEWLLNRKEYTYILKHISELNEMNIHKLIDLKYEEIEPKRLEVYHYLSKHSLIPMNSLHNLILYLCDSVSIYPEKSLEIMNLIMEKRKNKVIQILLQIDHLGSLRYLKEYQIFDIYLLYMLKSMIKRMKKIDLEIIKLFILKKFKEMTYEWDIIIEILLEYNNKECNEILDIIIEIFEKGEYYGNMNDFFKLIEYYIDLLNEKKIHYISSLFIKIIHPAHHSWKQDLKHFLKVYYPKNIQSIDLIKEMIFTLKIIADDILEELLPKFEYNPKNSTELSLKIIKLLIEIMKEIQTKKFFNLCHILEKYVLQEQTNEMNEIALLGMIEIFKIKFINLPCSDSSEMFLIFLKFIKHPNILIRENILKYLLTIKSDKNFQLQIDGVTSKYLKCHSMDIIRTISWVLPISLFVDALIEQLNIENQLDIILLILKGFKEMLLNKYILLEATKVIVRISELLLNRYQLFKKDIQIVLKFIECLTINYDQKDRKLVIQTLIYIIQNIDNARVKRYCIEGFNIHISETCLDEIFKIFQELLKDTENNEILLFPIFSFLDHLTFIPLSNNYSNQVFEMCFPYLKNDKIELSFILFRVLTCWFIKSDLKTRELLLKEYIPLNLDFIFNEVLCDFMIKYCYMNPNQYLHKDYIDKLFNGHEYNAWMLGNSVLTIQSGLFGYVLYRLRRPSGIMIWSMKLLNQENIDDMINPNMTSIYLRNWPYKDESIPLKLNDSLTRSLNMLDLIQSCDTCKFALLYISKGQSNEVDILKNTNGSRRYFDFLNQLGILISLKDLHGQYSGGLDTNPDTLMDGEYCLMFKDEISIIIYHVATLMPNHLNDDQCISKKRHIGNDYVTIIYSDNENTYDIETLKGEFNYVYIIIYPMRNDTNRVEVLVRNNIPLPHFGPLKRFQIVSDSNLPNLIRLTSIHAYIAVNSYNYLNKKFKTNWEERLRQIQTIKERFSLESK